MTNQNTTVQPTPDALESNYAAASAAASPSAPAELSVAIFAAAAKQAKLNLAAAQLAAAQHAVTVVAASPITVLALDEQQPSFGVRISRRIKAAFKDFPKDFFTRMFTAPSVRFGLPALAVAVVGLKVAIVDAPKPIAMDTDAMPSRSAPAANVAKAQAQAPTAAAANLPSPRVANEKDTNLPHKGADLPAADSLGASKAAAYASAPSPAPAEVRSSAQASVPIVLPTPTPAPMPAPPRLIQPTPPAAPGFDAQASQSKIAGASTAVSAPMAFPESAAQPAPNLPANAPRAVPTVQANRAKMAAATAEPAAELAGADARNSDKRADKTISKPSIAPSTPIAAATPSFARLGTTAPSNANLALRSLFMATPPNAQANEPAQERCATQAPTLAQVQALLAAGAQPGFTPKPSVGEATQISTLALAQRCGFTQAAAAMQAVK